ncbi:MAG: AI-2E family transporter [Calditrichaceae bacterium]
MDYTVGRFIKFIVIIMILAGIGWFLLTLRSTITILLVSGLLAYILDPIASYFELKGMSRTQATIVIFLIILVFFSAMGYFLVPRLIIEISNIQKGIQSDLGSSFIMKIEDMIRENLPMFAGQELGLEESINNILSAFSGTFFSHILDLVSLITTLVIIPFAVFFLLKDGRSMKKAFVNIIPNRYFEMVLNMIYKTDLQLGGYLRGQFFDAMIVGALSIIALWMLNVNYFILIGVFAGLANMIPYVGPLVGAVTAMLVVIMNGGDGQSLLMVGVAFAVIQLIDNVIIQPLVVAKSVDMHPLLVIFAVIIGGQFFGIVGMLLAVPATGITKVILQELFKSIRKYNLI